MRYVKLIIYSLGQNVDKCTYTKDALNGLDFHLNNRHYSRKMRKIKKNTSKNKKKSARNLLLTSQTFKVKLSPTPFSPSPQSKWVDRTFYENTSLRVIGNTPLVLMPAKNFGLSSNRTKNEGIKSFSRHFSGDWC